MLKITVKSNPGALDRLEKGLAPEVIDPVIERVALQAFAEVVQATPQKWFGQVRKSWQILTPRTGARLLLNDNKIMWFLEEGTRDHGPVTAKALYIPLNRRAALGYQKGMQFGKDFVLAKRVKGIQARHIAAQQARKTNQDLLNAMKEHIRQLIGRS